MEIRDPIHGFIQYDEKEERIINTKVFQRLRNIKQLALANYVYPGALHTRFDHSLGVMHLAKKIAEKLDLKKNKIKIVSLAGLLHDIGHGPFSHVSEQILETYTENLQNLLSKWKADNAHELMSILIIEFNEELKKAINDDKKRKEVIKILQKHKKRFLEKDIISGPLDADKLDYLLRDSYFTGVKYGVFDIDKIIESMDKIPIAEGIFQIGIKQEGIYALEQLLLAKYHMNTQVYHHRIRRIADAMVVRGVELAIKGGLEKLKEIFSIKDNEEFINKYVEFDDYALIDLVLKKGDAISKEYFNRIKQRRLFKEICSLELSKEELNTDVVVYNRIMGMRREDFENFAKSISEFLKNKFKINVKPEFIIVDRQTILNPTFKSPGIKIDNKTILVLRNKKKREPFSEVSEVFKNPTVAPEKNYLYVYAAIDSADRKKRTSLKNSVTKFVKEYLKKGGA